MQVVLWAQRFKHSVSLKAVLGDAATAEESREQDTVNCTPPVPVKMAPLDAGHYVL